MVGGVGGGGGGMSGGLINMADLSSDCCHEHHMFTACVRACISVCCRVGTGEGGGEGNPGRGGGTAH